MSISKTEVLDKLIEQDDAGTFLCRETLEPLFNEPWYEIEGYLFRLEEERLIELIIGGDEIQRILIRGCARARRRERPEPRSVQTINIRQGYGAVSIGDNRNSTITVQQISYQMRQEVSADLLQLFNTVDKRTGLDSTEAMQIKELLRQMLKCLEKSDTPPTGLLSELSERIQKHSWIAAPLATLLLKFLERLW